METKSSPLCSVTVRASDFLSVLFDEVVSENPWMRIPTSKSAISRAIKNNEIWEKINDRWHTVAPLLTIWQGANSYFRFGKHIYICYTEEGEVITYQGVQDPFVNLIRDDE